MGAVEWSGFSGCLVAWGHGSLGSALQALYLGKWPELVVVVAAVAVVPTAVVVQSAVEFPSTGPPVQPPSVPITQCTHSIFLRLLKCLRL